jgi:hypothetical protein
VSVGANERAAEYAGGPLRDVIPLQGFEQRQLDLGLLRDGNQIDLLLFTPLAQSSAETLRHAVHLRSTIDASTTTSMWD